VHTLLLTERFLFCREAKISYLKDPLLLKLQTTIEIERRIVMLKKLLILSLFISVLFVFSIPVTPVDAGDKSVKINWQITGTIVQTIDVYNPADQTSTGKHSLINLSAQGSPGPASITLLSKATTPGGTTTTLQCKDGYFRIADFEENDFVAIFPDQSLLFASIDKSAEGGGILCLNGQTYYNTYFTVKMLITGGTGRFEGAGGSFTGEGYGYPANPNSTLAGEIGKLTGKIEFSD